MLRLLFVTILFISMFAKIASDVYFPSIPAIARYFAVSHHQAQLTVTFYLVGITISQMIFGLVSDYYGRKRPLIFGVLLCLMGSTFCAQSTSINMLFFGRLLQGLGSGAGPVIARSILKDLYSGNELAKNNSVIAKFGVLIFTTSPILGGYIQHLFGWQYNFLFVAFFCCILVLMIVFCIDETLKIRSSRIKLADLWKILRNKAFIKNCMHLNLSYSGIISWLTATPIILQDVLHLSPADCKWLYACSGLGFFIGSTISIILLKRKNSMTVMGYGFVISTLSAVVMLTCSQILNIFAIILPVGLYMLGAGMVFPNGVASAMDQFKKNSGYASSILGSSQVLMGSFASCVISYLPEHNQLPLALVLLTYSTANLILGAKYLKGGSSC